MELEKAILGRRSIRRFKQDEIGDNILKKLINAAHFAPCGANAQNLRYVIATSPEKVNEIFRTTAWAAHVKPSRTPVEGKTAPSAFIAVTSKIQPPHVTYADAGAAIQNMLLMAFRLSIGACWLGSFDKSKAASIINSDKDHLLFLIALGYPDESPVYEPIDFNGSTKYYLDENDVLHVPKFKPEILTEWI
jgi:nitroreductase